MGIKWRHYEIGGYRLGHLKGQAVATWTGHDGQRHRERIGPAATETEARARLMEFVNARAKGDAAEKGRTVEAIFEAYTADRKADGKLVQNFHENWKALAPVFGKVQVSSINADMCRAYAQLRLDHGRSVNTAWTELGRLRSAVNWAAKAQIIPAAPHVWVPTKPSGKDRVLSRDEVVALIDGASTPHVRLFVMLALATAGRSAALLSLTWDRVDFEKRSVDLRPPKQRLNTLTKRAMKNRGVVHMNDWLRAALSEAKAGRLTDHVIEWSGWPVKCIRNGFTASVRRAGLGRDVTPHTLRHTAATWMAEAGHDMELIARLLGHTNPSVTRAVYANPGPASLSSLSEVVQIKKRA